MTKDLCKLHRPLARKKERREEVVSGMGFDRLETPQRALCLLPQSTSDRTERKQEQHGLPIGEQRCIEVRSEDRPSTEDAEGFQKQNNHSCQRLDDGNAYTFLFSIHFHFSLFWGLPS